MIYYILTFSVIILIATSLAYVNVRFNIYKKQILKNKISGFEVTDSLLSENEVDNIYILEKKNSYINNYDQNRNTLKLITSVFHGEDIVAVSTAIYEANNVLLIKKGNKSLKIYNNLQKILSICSKIGIISTLFGTILWKNAFIFGISILLIIILYQIIMFKYNEAVIKNSIKYIEKNKKITDQEKEKMIEIIKMSNVVNIAKLGYFMVENF